MASKTVIDQLKSSKHLDQASDKLPWFPQQEARWNQEVGIVTVTMVKQVTVTLRTNLRSRTYVRQSSHNKFRKGRQMFAWKASGKLFQPFTYISKHKMKVSCQVL